MNQAVTLPFFRKIRHLGEGGTAQVVQVFAEKFNHDAALKFPLESSEIDFKHLIEREYRLIGSSTYPGLVRILEVSTDEPCYILLELCNGPTLDTLSKIDNINLACNIISAIAINLEFLKSQSIVHGDLKPQNIFLPDDWKHCCSDRLFYLYLSDFSLGKKIDEPELNRAGIGTVGYMAPETINKGITNHKTDLFALGVTAYQLLTGRHPFMVEDSDPVKINSRIREDEPTPIEKLRPEIKSDIVKIINTLLEKDATRRPESGREVCRLLRQAGAQYPFEKALHPKYFIDMNKSYQENKPNLLALDEKQSKQLDLITGEDNRNLRMVLTANFVKANLAYEDGRFHLQNNIYWPVCLRRNTIKIYSQESFSDRKKMIKAAATGSLKNARQLDLVKDESFRYPAALFEILKYFLKTKTIKRLSSTLAPTAEKQNLHYLAAQLYLQGGNLKKAVPMSYEAAKNSNKDNQKETALHLLDKVIDYGRMTQQTTETRQLLMLKGDIHKEYGESEQAEAVYNNLLEIYKQLPPDNLLGETFKDLGDLFKIKRNFKAGINALQKALDIYKQLDNELEISHTYNNLGNIHWLNLDAESTLKCFRQALNIQKKLSAKADVASTLNNIGGIYGTRGYFKRAINILKISLRLNRNIGKKVEISRTLNNLGYTYFICGYYERAIDCLKESLDINLEIGTKKDILYNYENLTILLYTSGRLNDSLKYLKEGLNLSKGLDDKPHLATFNIEIGNVLKRMGQLSEANKVYQTASDIIVKLNDPFLRLQLQNHYAELRFHIGDHQKALELSKNTLIEAESVDDKQNILLALIQLTRLSSNSYYEKTTEVMKHMQHKREKVILKFNRIESLLENEDYVPNFEDISNSIKELNKIQGDIELSRFYNCIAELMLRTDELEDAHDLLIKAQATAKKCGLLPELIDNAILLGKYYYSKKDYEECYKKYKEGLKYSKIIIENIDNDTDRNFYQNKRMMKFLINEIQKLRRTLGQKQRAGV